jgi:ribosomal-protein-serine acetyltransferase
VSAVRRLPERVVGPGAVVVRRWLPADAEALVTAVTESAEHLRPWMPWIAQEPMSVGQRLALIEDWNRDWAVGGDAVMGVFVGDQIAGGSGLHRRLGPDGLEIGYWIHTDFTRRGLATLVSALLTDAAFELPEIQRVQITHDKANVASGGVPRRLGFSLVDEKRDPIEAPGEVGISCRWQIARDEWRHRAPLASGVSPRI